MSTNPGEAQFFASITFVSNYVHPWLGRYGALDHIWSLCVEEHVYVVLAMVAWIDRRRLLAAPRAIAALMTIAFVAGAYDSLSGVDYYLNYWRSHTRGASILAGALLHLVAAHRWRAAQASPHAAALCGFAALLCSTGVVPDALKYTLGALLAASTLVLLERSHGWSRRLLETRWIVAAGTHSYSLYLWQQPFYKMSHGPWVRAAALPVAIVVGVVSYRWLETPLRKWVATRLTKPRLAPGVGASP